MGETALKSSTKQAAVQHVSDDHDHAHGGLNQDLELLRAIPSETAVPFPGDGINGPNALVLSGVVRSNIKGSLTTATVASGVPLTINLKLVSASCADLAGTSLANDNVFSDGASLQVAF